MERHLGDRRHFRENGDSRRSQRNRTNPKRQRRLPRLPTVSAPQEPAEPDRGVRMKCMVEFEPRDVEWLWADRVPLGMLTLFAGDPMAAGGCKRT
jgi:hypothetical protein